MIELIPAIDLIDGKCVRLAKGDYSSKKVYADDPAAVAKEFESHGLRRLHVVDLDGARSKHVVNHKVLERIVSAVNMTVDFGGGIKTDEDLHIAFESGASLVTVGSVAVTSPDIFLKWLDLYGAERLILGADVNNGKIAINGWSEGSDKSLFPFLEFYLSRGTRHVLCTEISNDGMLKGPATLLYKEIMKKFPACRLIASGGVSSIGDVEALNRSGIPAVVIGKAIYEGKVKLSELQRLTKSN